MYFKTQRCFLSASHFFCSQLKVFKLKVGELLNVSIKTRTPTGSEFMICITVLNMYINIYIYVDMEMVRATVELIKQINWILIEFTSFWTLFTLLMSTRHCHSWLSNVIPWKYIYSEAALIKNVLAGWIGEWGNSWYWGSGKIQYCHSLLINVSALCWMAQPQAFRHRYLFHVLASTSRTLAFVSVLFTLHTSLFPYLLSNHRLSVSKVQPIISPPQW